MFISSLDFRQSATAVAGAFIATMLFVSAAASLPIA
jgi:hypothetical protein